MSSLEILVADDETLVAMGLSSLLTKLGHRVVGRAKDGTEAVRQALELEPDLVFLDIRMPGMDGLAAAREILARFPVPIVILTAYTQPDLIQAADESGVSGYLVKPVTEEDLMPAITLAISRFRQLRALQQEVGDLKLALETRKRVERAKGILMERHGLPEAEAFRRLQRMSRNQNIPMGKIAEAIITASELL